MGRAFEYRKARIMARNSKNSKMFSKLSKEITMCVKASGPDPDNNSRLRTLIATAKSASMPKDTIDRAIKKGSDYFTKYGGTLGTTGSLSFLFAHKSVFTVKAKEGVDMDELELELIDYGVDEIYFDEEENTITAYGEYESYAQMQQYFEENGFEIVSAEFVRIPNDTKEVTPEQRETLDKLLAKFDEDEDVTNVFTNIKEEDEEE